MDFFCFSASTIFQDCRKTSHFDYSRSQANTTSTHQYAWNAIPWSWDPWRHWNRNMVPFCDKWRTRRVCWVTSRFRIRLNGGLRGCHWGTLPPLPPPPPPHVYIYTSQARRKIVRTGYRLLYFSSIALHFYSDSVLWMFSMLLDNDSLSGRSALHTFLES